ncbi:MAG: hypothetical protein WBF76_20680, partial [Pseudonocardiaceae bacterium]
CRSSTRTWFLEICGPQSTHAPVLLTVLGALVGDHAFSEAVRSTRTYTDCCQGMSPHYPVVPAGCFRSIVSAEFSTG